jgi:dipeptidyl aminopeptidase/acylaminoacyl peptidase
MGHFETDGPRLSPDGRFVVVDILDPRVNSRDVHLISLSGEAVRLVEHPANDRAPVWAADGSHVLFLSDRTGGDSLWRIPVANGRATGPAVPMSSSLSGIHGLMTPTRDGGLFYWTGGASNNVYVAELDDTQRLKGTPTLAIERFLNANYLPSWSPDGQSIAYATQQGTRRPTKLMVRSLATGGDREVPFTKTPAGRVSWFPDGRSLLVAVVDQLHMNYYRVDIATGAAEEVMKTVTRSMPGRRPLVSADGSAIFYVDGPEEMANGRSMLMRFDLGTGRRTMIRQVTAEDDSIASFELSPDGKQIAVRVDEGNTRANIFEVMATDGSGRRELFRTTSTGGERFGGLAWTSDQRFILFPDPVPSGAIALWKVSTNGGPAQETGIRMARNLGAPGVHGNRVVFGGREGGTPPTIWVLENFLPAKP